MRSASDTNEKAHSTDNADGIRVRLHHSRGTVDDIKLDAVDLSALDDQALLWVDLTGNSEHHLQEIAAALELDAAQLEGFRDTSAAPELRTGKSSFFVRVIAVRHEGNLTFNGTVLSLMAGANYVISAHPCPISFLDELREREAEDSDLGALSADSFVASILDWQVNSYFEAVSHFETATERLETAILDERDSHCLTNLRGLRKAASRLRRMLSAHRPVFAAMDRPDFRPSADGAVNRHFQTLDLHFERAMDAVEGTREMVIGSFELFSNQTALRTNDVIRVLTVVTALMGGLAVIAGALGMNFKMPFFETGWVGFAVAVGGMLLLAAGSLVLARWRKWI
jgi:magnesium transporter